jgi:molecular chaperone DnaK (HSP70)
MLNESQLNSFYGAFEVLDVQPTLDADTIKEAFRSVALKHHPDRFQTLSEKQEAHNAFVLVSNARDYLLELIQQPEVIDSFDVIPMSLGYRAEHDLLRPIIRVGTIIPCESVVTVEIERNLTDDFAFDVFQGVRPIVGDNPVLCTIIVEADLVSTDFLTVHLILRVDENGILYFMVRDAIDLHEFKVRMSNHSGGLSDNNISAHKQEALRNQKSDRERKYKARQ